MVTQNIRFISETQISEQNWITAKKLTDHVDGDDIAFVALALEMKCPLWTGDKKLQRQITGIEIFNTEQIAEQLKN